jgi:hypothetical protein
MASKIDTSYSGMFLDTKLKTVLKDLNKELIDSRFSTKEDVSSLFNKVIRQYYQNLTQSIFHYKTVSSGVDPDINKINEDYFMIFNDLKILYTSLSNTRNLLTSNFNTLSGMIYKVKSDIAEASSNLIDYKLQNTNKFSPTFTDSFFNLSKVENDGSKYTGTKAFIDTFNNNVVLPLDGEAKVGKITKVSIVENSIGTSGNNQEIGSLARDNLKLAVDNSNDTWFEFEQVGSNELEVPTVLNIKLELEEEIFFNLLDVNTIQMPNGSYPAIIDIKGSIDGSSFFDLKPLFLGENSKDSIGNQVIQLGENPDNPNNGNLLYFTPRKVKYLSIKFIEDSSFFIRTSAGIKYRRAIGIRELKAKSQKFKNQGQFISTTFLVNQEVSKISLNVGEYLPPNFKTTFTYFASVDNGLNWTEISPAGRNKNGIANVLNYNIDYLESSIKTDTPVASIKLKSDFLIEEGSETTSVTASYLTKKQTEFNSIAPGSKTITLSLVPFGNVHMYKTNFGSVGKDLQLKLPNGSMKELSDRWILQLPLEVFPVQSIQIDQDSLFIDNYAWSRVDEILSTHSPNELVYEFDYTNNIVTFQKDFSGTKAGKKPSGDIYFKLKRENILFKPGVSGSVIKTNFPHDAIKENISIYSIAEKPSTINYKLRNLASVHRLTVSEIDFIQIITDTNGILNSEKAFINGVVELSTNGDYSIDKKRGILYTYKPLNNLEEVLITATYADRIPLNFEIKDGELITSDDVKKDNKTFDINLAVEQYAVDLGFRNIDERSIVFLEFPAILETEVKFENISAEFNQLGSSGKYAIDYRNGILYVQNKIDGKLKGTLVNSNYYAEYNITYKIPDTAYTLIRDEKKIEFSDKYITDFFNSSSNESQNPSLLKIEYDYTEDVKESLSELFPFTTPFLMEYQIVTTPKEVL